MGLSAKSRAPNCIFTVPILRKAKQLLRALWIDYNIDVHRNIFARERERVKFEFYFKKRNQPSPSDVATRVISSALN